MKIGILTFHCPHNYGAVLQAYALQEKLKSMGHEVEIIDYRPDYLLSPYSAFSIRNNKSRNPIYLFRRFVESILTFYTKIKRRKVFKEFIHNKLDLSEDVSGIIPNYYDLYILGSDQIWNFSLTRGFDKVYYGFFKTFKASKKITYAASFGKAIIKEKEMKSLEVALKNFDGISLREKESIPLLKSITKSEIVNVLDPTLIADISTWNNIALKPFIRKKYVLVYQVTIDKQTRIIADYVAKQINATIVEIPAWVTFQYLSNNQLTTSPEQFLGWIKYADCIITSSFHGTAFSILFNKPFYTVNLNDGSENRPKNLLEDLGLTKRLINKNSFPEYESIDFQDANKKLDILRQYSINYLNQFLKS